MVHRLLFRLKFQVLNWMMLDMNGTHHDTVDDLPSSLEFSKMVHISRPVLIRGIRKVL